MVLSVVERAIYDIIGIELGAGLAGLLNSPLTLHSGRSTILDRHPAPIDRPMQDKVGDSQACEPIRIRCRCSLAIMIPPSFYVCVGFHRACSARDQRSCVV